MSKISLRDRLFTDFQASGVDIADAATIAHLDSQGLSGPGRAYDDGSLFIACGPVSLGETLIWQLTIGNRPIEYRGHGALAAAERELYDWAVSEGYFT